MDHLYETALGFVPTYSDTITLAEVPFLNTSNSHLFFGTDASPTRILELRVSALSPVLEVARSGNGAVVSWPLYHGDGWQLQVNTNLSLSTAWTELPPPYPTNATHHVVTELPPSGNKFYRLKDR